MAVVSDGLDRTSRTEELDSIRSYKSGQHTQSLKESCSTHVRGSFHASIQLHKKDIFRVDQLADSNVLPISSRKSWIGRASGWRVVYEVVDL